MKSTKEATVERRFVTRVGRCVSRLLGPDCAINGTMYLSPDGSVSGRGIIISRKGEPGSPTFYFDAAREDRQKAADIAASIAASYMRFFSGCPASATAAITEPACALA